MSKSCLVSRVALIEDVGFSSYGKTCAFLFARFLVKTRFDKRSAIDQSNFNRIAKSRRLGSETFAIVAFQTARSQFAPTFSSPEREFYLFEAFSRSSSNDDWRRNVVCRLKNVAPLRFLHCVWRKVRYNRQYDRVGMKTFFLICFPPNKRVKEDLCRRASQKLTTPNAIKRSAV